jgi:hypothetical protein
MCIVHSYLSVAVNNGCACAATTPCFCVWHCYWPCFLTDRSLCTSCETCSANWPRPAARPHLIVPSCYLSVLLVEMLLTTCFAHLHFRSCELRQDIQKMCQKKLWYGLIRAPMSVLHSEGFFRFGPVQLKILERRGQNPISVFPFVRAKRANSTFPQPQRLLLVGPGPHIQEFECEYEATSPPAQWANPPC